MTSSSSQPTSYTTKHHRQRLCARTVSEFLRWTNHANSNKWRTQVADKSSSLAYCLASASATSTRQLCRPPLLFSSPVGSSHHKHCVCVRSFAQPAAIFVAAALHTRTAANCAKVHARAPLTDNVRATNFYPRPLQEAELTSDEISSERVAFKFASRSKWRPTTNWPTHTHTSSITARLANKSLCSLLVGVASSIVSVAVVVVVVKFLSSLNRRARKASEKDCFRVLVRSLSSSLVR